MDRATPSTGFANTLHCALELSKKSWLLAISKQDAPNHNSGQPDRIVLGVPWKKPPAKRRREIIANCAPSAAAPSTASAGPRSNPCSGR